ncbi:MAG: thiamine phosphate synthase [Clostridium sp.]|nr:thiamine phosphate synthase [Clostridium sp.]
MLQFITDSDRRYSVAEQVQMVLEGGCRWIQLRMAEDASDEEIRETAREIIPICREQSAFLLLEGHPELARELGLHGVHLGPGDIRPAQARELLGAEAIIGVTVRHYEDILPLAGVDVDYVSLGPFRRHVDEQGRGLDAAAYREIIAAIRRRQIDVPVVAWGSTIALRDIEDLIRGYVNGVALSASITGADDPVVYTSEAIHLLEKSRGERK